LAGLLSRTAGNWLLRAPFWLPKEWDLAPHHRENPLYLHQGYPLMLDQEFDFALPPEARFIELPPTSRNEAGPLRWVMEWTRAGENAQALHAKLRVELTCGELSLQETHELQRHLPRLFEALASGASFSLTP